MNTNTPSILSLRKYTTEGMWIMSYNNKWHPYYQVITPIATAPPADTQQSICYSAPSAYIISSIFASTSGHTCPNPGVWFRAGALLSLNGTEAGLFFFLFFFQLTLFESTARLQPLLPRGVLLVEKTVCGGWQYGITAGFFAKTRHDGKWFDS